MSNEETKRFVSKMIRVNRLHKSLIEKFAYESQLHRSQHQILIYLMNCKEPPSQKEIAAAFEVTPAAIAMSLKKLYAKGYINRVVADEDNRVNLITISDKGREIIEENKVKFDKTDAAMLEGVTDDDLKYMSGVLDKFIENLIRIGAEDDIPAFMKNGHGCCERN